MRIIRANPLCLTLSLTGSGMSLKNHSNELLDANKRLYTNSVSAGYSKMVVLTFYFE